MSEKKQQDGAFLKIVASRVQSTGTIENLYECFNKHRQHILDDKIASLFVDRIAFFKAKSVSNYDSEKCEELLLDIEAERSIHCPSVVKVMGSPTVNLSVDVKGGSVYESCLAVIIRMAIDRVGTQKSAIISFLGIPHDVLNDILYKNRELRLYWDEIRRKHKRFDE